jgi:hypothetical protein
MNDIDKINAKLDAMKAARQSKMEEASNQAGTLDAALRIAVKGLERCQKRTLHAKNTIWAVAEALEGKQIEFNAQTDRR